MSNVPTLEELFKSGLLKKGNDKKLVCRRVPMGIPALDSVLGGGLPIGRPMLLYGPESTGKTLLAQYAVKAIQQTERSQALLMDLEHSYDQVWWEQSGVNSDQLIVSQPAAAEQAIDIMRAMLSSSPELGIIVLDGIAAMVPSPEIDPNRSSEERTIGLQARVTTLMYRQLMSLMEDVVFIATNQMRESIGTHDTLSALPGGRAQRHYSQIILSTRRDGWIHQGNQRIGFHLSVGLRKNKTAPPIMDEVTIDFLFKGQIDYITSYLDEAISRQLITNKGPWFYYNDKNYLGKPAVREFFASNPEEFEQLKAKIA